MGRVKLRFARGLEVEFRDRDRALQQVEWMAERGTLFPTVVYGPEGCGKTALLMQAKAILEEHGYHVVYASPLEEEAKEMLSYTPTLGEIAREIFKAFPEPYSRVVDVAIAIASEAVRRLRRPRVALLIDDIFQAVGVDRAEVYVKMLLNLIEYPPGDYESIVVLVSSSEGVTRERIGRHNWATIKILWNMSREGFKQLYDVIPDGGKLEYETLWRLTGGNPRHLRRLYEAEWNVDITVKSIVKERKLDILAATLSREEVEVLKQVLGDPDSLVEHLREKHVQELERRLVELNLIMYMHDRDEHFWIDQPPPERDQELGIGRFYAWQTPLHREAVRRVLNAVSK